MKKQICVYIVFACVFCISIPNTVLGQGIPLAQQVFRKHKQTLQRADVQEVLPQALEGLKAPDNQRFLNPQTINLVVDNPDLLPIFIPDIAPKFVALLKADWELKNFLRDPLVQRLLQSPAAIDELALLLGVGGAGRNLPDLPAQQIYDQAMRSVVWITTIQGDLIGKGSGVLIDRKRRLVVTNEHVIDGAEWVHVFFPYEGQNGLEIEENFYVDNWDWLEKNGYATEAGVIRRNVRNDLAIIQLRRLPLTAREIEHDFSRNVEDSMKKGDTVHILGNPGIQLWDWDRGVFVSDWGNCLPNGGACLEMEVGVRGGNSGGPVLNGRGMLIGIVSAGDRKTITLAAPAKNVKVLLNSVPANLAPLPPPRTYPQRTFKIRNQTGVTIPYEIKWSDGNNWQRFSLQTGFIKPHRSDGQNVSADYPKIRFDYIAGDRQVTYRVYNLESVAENANVSPTYYFQFNRQGDRLDLFRDVRAAPTLSKAVPEETTLLSNYPNPFNPETWIPYKLSESATVTITIYSADGTLVRTLKLGHQPAGVYQDKSRAAYWEGKNELSEPVASGVYFYTLTVGDFTATRKMLIVR